MSWFFYHYYHFIITPSGLIVLVEYHHIISKYHTNCSCLLEDNLYHVLIMEILDEIFPTLFASWYWLRFLVRYFPLYLHLGIGSISWWDISHSIFILGSVGFLGEIFPTLFSSSWWDISHSIFIFAGDSVVGKIHHWHLAFCWGFWFHINIL